MYVVWDCSLAAAIIPHPNGTVSIERVEVSPEDLERPGLDFWPACIASGSVAFAQPLCIDDDPSSYSPYIVLDGMLRTGVVGADALCIVDSSAVLSERECTKSRPEDGTGRQIVGTSLELILRLAQSWRDLNVFERADQLYQWAYVVVARGNARPAIEVFILQEWTSLNVARGKLERARDLANRRTTLARRAFECDPAWVSMLKSALETEARILTELGEVEAAASARREADSLPVSAPEICREPSCMSKPLRECLNSDR